jgi:LysR family tcuABC transcriptional regulator
MELRQLRYFVRIVETGSMGRAALDLNIGVSALSQQIARLENELAIRLLQRTSRGVTPTSAGLAFYSQAQLALRHADDAILAAREARLSATSASAWPPAPPPFSAFRSSTRCAKATPTSACIWWKASPVIWSG